MIKQNVNNPASLTLKTPLLILAILITLSSMACQNTTPNTPTATIKVNHEFAVDVPFSLEITEIKSKNGITHLKITSAFNFIPQNGARLTIDPSPKTTITKGERFHQLKISKNKPYAQFQLSLSGEKPEINAHLTVKDGDLTYSMHKKFTAKKNIKH